MTFAIVFFLWFYFAVIVNLKIVRETKKTMKKIIIASTTNYCCVVLRCLFSCQVAGIWLLNFINYQAEAQGEFYRTYGASGSCQDIAYESTELSDGSIIVAGRWSSCYGSSADVGVLKLDASGNIVKAVRWGHSNNPDQLNTVIHFGDTLIVAGGYVYNGSMGYTQAYLAGMDSSLNLLWSMTYWNTGASWTVTKIIPTLDDQILAVGYRTSGGTENPIFFKVDKSNGNLLSSVYADNSYLSSPVRFSEVVALNDSSFVACGLGPVNTIGYFARITKNIGLSSPLNMAHAAFTQQQGPYSLRLASDGNIWALGYASASGNTDILLLKLNAANMSIMQAWRFKRSGNTTYAETGRDLYDMGNGKLFITSVISDAIVGFIFNTQTQQVEWVRKIDTPGRKEYAWQCDMTPGGKFLITGYDNDAVVSGNENFLVTRIDTISAFENCLIYDDSITVIQEPVSSFAQNSYSATYSGLGSSSSPISFTPIPVSPSVLLTYTPLTLTFSTNAPVCEGNQLNFSVSANSSGANYTYLWSGPGNYSSTQASNNIPAAQASYTGYYSVSVGNDQGCTTKDSIFLQVYPSPNPIVSVNGNTLTVNNVFSSYQWLDCNNNYAPISGATQQSYLVSVSGSYAVLVTDNNGCADTSACQVITVTNIESFAGSGQVVRVYPNPSVGKVFIDIDGEEGDEVEVWSVMGKVLVRASVDASGTGLDLSSFAPGLYYIRVIADGKTIWIDKVMIR